MSKIIRLFYEIRRAEKSYVSFFEKKNSKTRIIFYWTQKSSKIEKMVKKKRNETIKLRQTTTEKLKKVTWATEIINFNPIVSSPFIRFFIHLKFYKEHRDSNLVWNYHDESLGQENDFKHYVLGYSGRVRIWEIMDQSMTYSPWSKLKTSELRNLLDNEYQYGK